MFSSYVGIAFAETYLINFKTAFRKVRMKQILSISNVSLLYVGKAVEIYFTYGMPLNLDDLRRHDLPSPPSTPLIQVHSNLIISNQNL